MKKISVIIIALALAVTAFAGCSAAQKANTAAESSTKEASSEALTKEAATEKATEEQTKEEQTSEAVSEEATVPAEAVDYLKNGVWYLYLEDTQEAYAFTFTGKDRVEVAYFSSDNTQGLDSKYSTTSQDYEINNVEGTVIVETAVPFKDGSETYMFTLQGDKLCYGKDELPNEKEVSLETVFNHFNA